MEQYITRKAMIETITLVFPTEERMKVYEYLTLNGYNVKYSGPYITEEMFPQADTDRGMIDAYRETAICEVLRERVKELQAGIEPLTRVVPYLLDDTEDDVYLGTQLRGVDNDVTPTVGECRYAATLLAKPEDT